MLCQPVHQPGELGRAEEGGRATAPVQLGHAAAAVEVAREQRDLLFHGDDVALGNGRVAGDDLVAGAVVADVAAVRDVHVQRQRADDGGTLEQILLVFARPEASVNCSAVG